MTFTFAFSFTFSVRVYGEHRDLSFLLYEKHMAIKFFAAQVRAQKMGITVVILAQERYLEPALYPSGVRQGGCMGSCCSRRAVGPPRPLPPAAPEPWCIAVWLCDSYEPCSACWGEARRRVSGQVSVRLYAQPVLGVSGDVWECGSCCVCCSCIGTPQHE